MDFAHKKGIELNLNPDFKLLETDFLHNGEKINAALWIRFKNNLMISSVEISKGEVSVLKKSIDQARIGIEFFLDMYKQIVFQDGFVVIKGSKKIDCSPLKIVFP